VGDGCEIIVDRHLPSQRAPCIDPDHPELVVGDLCFTADEIIIESEIHKSVAYIVLWYAVKEARTLDVDLAIMGDRASVALRRYERCGPNHQRDKTHNSKSRSDA